MYPHSMIQEGRHRGVSPPPILFNMVVDNVIRNWLSLTIDNPAATHDGVGEAVGQELGVFYAENGIIASHNTKGVQGDINFLIGLFRIIGPRANITKSKTMTCHTGDIRSGMSAEAFTIRSI